MSTKPGAVPKHETTNYAELHALDYGLNAGPSFPQAGAGPAQLAFHSRGSGGFEVLTSLLPRKVVGIK
jgi:hypothetical protein